MNFDPQQVKNFTEDYMRASGKRMASARAATALTQAQLAEMSGVTQQMISYAEAGIRLPSFVVQMKLCAALRINHADIWPSPDRGLFHRRAVIAEVAA